MKLVLGDSVEGGQVRWRNDRHCYRPPAAVALTTAARRILRRVSAF